MAQNSMASSQEHIDSKGGTGDWKSAKFASLRFIARLFQALGILLGAIVGLGTAAVFANKPFLEPEGLALEPEMSTAYILTTLVVALLGLLFSLFVYATGEAIKCFVDIEQNTRRIKQAVDDS